MPLQVRRATAVAHPNIALIKYWGNRDAALRLPANGSISMTLDRLETRTTVAFDPSLGADLVIVDGVHLTGAAFQRVTQHLDRVREMAGINLPARVESQSNFPAGTGLAASASAFAALTLAATHAAGLSLDRLALSRLARLGSGSACRSIYGGFVEWLAGESHEESYATPLAPPDHWNLVDAVAIVSREPKAVGSTAGHALAPTSPLQAARVQDAPRRLDLCREAIQKRNFPRLASVVEQDSNMMHAVMMTSTPPLLYWEPATIQVMREVSAWRAGGLPVCYTVDAGPNVHCLCLSEAAEEVRRRLESLPGVLEVLLCGPGGPAEVVEAPPASR